MNPMLNSKKRLAILLSGIEAACNLLHDDDASKLREHQLKQHADRIWNAACAMRTALLNGLLGLLGQKRSRPPTTP